MKSIHVVSLKHKRFVFHNSKHSIASVKQAVFFISKNEQNMFQVHVREHVLNIFISINMNPSMTEQQMYLRFIKADHTMETILDWEKYINFLTNLHPHLLDDFFFEWYCKNSWRTIISSNRKRKWFFISPYSLSWIGFFNREFFDIFLKGLIN